MITVGEWTGEEALLLQSVKRMSVRVFADHLGVAPRTITYWKADPTTKCLLPTQQVLDLALARCSPEEQEAFRVRLAALRGEAVRVDADAARPMPCTVVSHKFLPVYVDDRLGGVTGAARPAGPGGLEQRLVPAGHPTAHTSTIHLYECGVAVVYLEEHRSVKSLTELAVWRYRSYLKDRAWAGQRLAALLDSVHVGEARSQPLPMPEYVLSAYELRDHSWERGGLETALQLLATPSVLVNRQDPDNVVPLGAGVEDAKFAEAWVHPEAVSFGGGVSRGVVGWSGVAYHPQRDERALTMSDIVRLELDVQALWALSSHVLHMVENGLDPVMPEEFGWRYLRSAFFRLTTARPTETAQHRAMREAILATSELPDRLRAAQEVLRDGSP